MNLNALAVMNLVHHEDRWHGTWMYSWADVDCSHFWLAALINEFTHSTDRIRYHHGRFKPHYRLSLTVWAILGLPRRGFTIMWDLVRYIFGVSNLVSLQGDYSSFKSRRMCFPTSTESMHITLSRYMWTSPCWSSLVANLRRICIHIEHSFTRIMIFLHHILAN